MRIAKLLALLLFISSLQSVAQTQGDYIKSDYFANQIPKNPGVAPLGNFGNVPVNYFTGQPEISLPLMTLTSQELSLPISLNYDASGIKTDEISGQVGLKWALNAASYIVRDLNGLPDEEPTKGYWTQAYATDYWNNANLDDWTGYSERNDYDSKPDEFIVNLNGRSIKFVFDKNRKAFTIPRQNVEITYTLLNNKIDKFQVVTEDGTIYIFGGTPIGGTATTIEERKIESLNVRLRFSYDETREDVDYGASYFTRNFGVNEVFSSTFENTEKTIDFYNSKWFVQSITSPANDQITFTYEKKTNVKYTLKPTITRAKPLLVTLASYKRTVQGACKQAPIFGGCPWGYWYYDFVHPCLESACPNPVINSRPLLAIRKFTWTVPGSSPPPPNDGVGIPGDTPDPNAIPSSGIVTQSDLKWYFPPETYKADPGGVVANHLLITESNIILKSIQSVVKNSVGNKVLFDVSSRNDLVDAWKYDRISLVNLNGEAIKIIKLNYATINAKEDTNDAFWVTEALMMNTIDILTQAGPDYYAYFAKAYTEASIPDVQLRKYVYEGLKDYNYKRLFLESIEDATASKKFPLYTFTYNETPANTRTLLKRRTTPMADGYGFYRNVAPDEFIGLKNNKKAKMILGYSPGAPSTGKNKLCGILTRITYPTSGYTEFSYLVGLGPKIQMISDFDEVGGIVNRREIEYLNTTINYDPTFGSYQEYKLKDTNDWMKYSIASTSPQNDLPNKASLEVHSKVRVYSGTKTDNMGWEDLIFKVNADSVSRLYASPPDTDVNGANCTLPGTNKIYPFIRPEAHDHLEGYLEEQHTFDKSDAVNPIRSIINTYLPNPYGYVPAFAQGFNGGSYQYTSGTKNTFWYGTVSEAVNRNRFGTYKINSDWMVLTKTTETKYSQTDKTKKFVKVTDYVYDPINLQVVETSMYNVNNPNSKVITKTKWVTHQDYNYSVSDKCGAEYENCLTQCGGKGGTCASDCRAQEISCNGAGSGSSETDAMIALNSSHQINKPIELQTLVQEGSTASITSAVVYKYIKQAGGKPSQILGLKQTLATNLYVTSKVDANGSFKSDSKLRKLHSFDSYDATTGNLLQQTTMDGIVSTYAWGYNNSLVSGFTINPGASALTYTYDQKPLVGLNSSTDPNLRKSYYEYDNYWRLKLSKDHDGNIVSRYRYNYAAEQNGFDDQLSVCCVFWPGQSLTFSSTDPNVTTGTTTYSWDFGNGVKTTSSGATTYAYPAAGTFSVTLNKENPEYPPRTVTKVITLSSTPTVSICVNGPLKVDLCGTAGSNYGSCTVSPNNTPTGSTFVKATIVGVCTSPTYSWEYQKDGGSWQIFGSGSQTEFFVALTGSYNVRCRITTGCGGEIVSATQLITVYKSTTNCTIK